MAKPIKPKTSRPLPPENYGNSGDDGELQLFKPAPDVLEWARANLIADGKPLSNPDHAHLADADIAMLWAPGGFVQKMRRVIGQAERVSFRVGGWQKARQEEQMYQWFGRIPEFLITLDASYCRACTDTEFCALLDHELYHIAQEKDEYGQLKFTEDGRPKLTIRGHDVEEFVGVVRRYGVGDPEGGTARLVAAAKQRPEVSGINIARACGTCMLRAA